MNKISFVILFFLLTPCLAVAQVTPKEGVILNYRLIGFSFPSPAQATTYRIEIAHGNINANDSFKEHIIKTIEGTGNKIIAEVPSFGQQYTWRITYPDKKTPPAASELHHFSTGIIPNADTAIFRLHIMEQATAYKDALVFSDGNKVLYDMKGNPVWYLPNIEGKIKEYSWVRDLQLTPRGTITFILDDHRIYEINYNGDILWKGPDNESTNDGPPYHHQFTRLDNGHYMALGTENVFWKLNSPIPKDGSLYSLFYHKTLADSNDTKIYPASLETLIEYDNSSHVVWRWEFMKYFKNSDLYYCKGEKGKPSLEAHLNAFYFDESAKVIYLSFKSISRIIKISYPSGNVINTYGEILKPGTAIKENELFCHQHSCRRSMQGYLYMYNNGCDLVHPPKVTMFQEPLPGKHTLNKVWEYECSFDDYVPRAFSAAGNVLELPDNSLFVSMGTPYSKVFIVSRDKKILWSAIPQKWNSTEKKWDISPQYRAFIITNPKHIEKLIWNQ